MLLPGREERYSEAPYTRADDLVPLLAEHLSAHFDKPFAFFGHSLGGRMAFALARHLSEQRMPLPRHLFLSGCAPQPSRVQRHELPDQELLKEIRAMNGAPPEALANVELMELLLPTIRADFALAEDCVPRTEARVPVPVTAFAGQADPEARLEQARHWARHTTGGFESVELPGDHFFLHEPTRLLNLLGQRVTAGVPRPTA